MLGARGYAGSAVQVRRWVRTVRPAARAEAYLRLETLPGEQGQVDWGKRARLLRNLPAATEGFTRLLVAGRELRAPTSSIAITGGRPDSAAPTASRSRPTRAPNQQLSSVGLP